jgi:hypothetical protein
MTHQFRENGNHFNGGEVFFGYGYTAIDEPRLKLIRKWFRKGPKRGLYEDSYYVDGKHVADYEDAIEALKVPVSFTNEELMCLAIIGDEPFDYRPLVPVQIRSSLADKGAIEWGPPGRCRRTDVGRAALVAKDVD